MYKINVKKLGTEATIPTRAHASDAGLDLYASETVVYKPNEIFVVNTSIAVNIVKGYVGLIRDRSSVGKFGLKVTGGVVDAGYTGEVKVVLINLTGKAGQVDAGSKIAQLLILPVALPTVEEVESFEASDRGDKGFGSSGR